jgi:NAD(P)-dependent dehydrogenase (short-subunit alcohol dehydrogenase family)
MDLQLTGRRAFVSGSTQGIGYAVARTLAEEGVTVVLNGRDEERVRAAVDRLAGEVPGADVSGIAADLADAHHVDRLLAALGEVDVLVANVGLFEVRTFTEITDADWSRYLELNLMSAVRLSRDLLPRMLDRGWGRVVLISSESGVDVPGDMVHYGVTKAGMIALGNGLAKLTRGSAVTVNTVLGGPTYSDGVAGVVTEVAAAQGLAADDLRATLGASRSTSLLQRFIDPAEIAHLVAYLASPRSSATNGAALRADGGVLPTML